MSGAKFLIYVLVGKHFIELKRPENFSLKAPLKCHFVGISEASLFINGSTTEKELFMDTSSTLIIYFMSCFHLSATLKGDHLRMEMRAGQRRRQKMPISAANWFTMLTHNSNSRPSHPQRFWPLSSCVSTLPIMAAE